MENNQAREVLHVYVGCETAGPGNEVPTDVEVGGGRACVQPPDRRQEASKILYINIVGAQTQAVEICRPPIVATGVPYARADVLLDARLAGARRRPRG